MLYGVAMNKNEFGPLRCKLPRKPWLKRAEVRFYHCPRCGRVLHEYIPEHPRQETPAPSLPLCCAGSMTPLAARPPRADLRYDITGGFNNNAVKAVWDGVSPLWILLQTYTGIYLKHIPPEKRPPVVFPLADEDAYAYCDRDVCEKCLYCCKKGCILYFYFGEEKLCALPLDQISEYFRRKS